MNDLIILNETREQAEAARNLAAQLRKEVEEAKILIVKLESLAQKLEKEALF